MRHRNVLTIIAGITAVALLPLATTPAQAQLVAFTPQDWLVHRGTPTRQGLNADPGLTTGKQLSRVWLYPATQDMPAEMVVDNTILPVPSPAFPAPTAGYPANTQDFTVTTPAAWTYPDIGLRTGGAWPPTDPTFNKLGDYVYTDAVKSQTLATIGTTVLAALPNLSSVISDQVHAADVYKQIHQALVADTKYARWSFGTTYPYGTVQGTRQISYIKTTPAPGAPVDPTDYHLMPIPANQRYAVYIRFPSSGTTDIAGNNRPNVDHAMVRVSWGADPNDPVSSRIFMVNFGQTGGTWVRLRTGAGDDRYFPYDGTNPIRVTLYSVTPDDPTDQTEFGFAPIVPADSVRLVPEALRGDIHGSPASATYDLTQLPNQPIGVTPRTTQLTYFGRDETTGPPFITDLTKTFAATGLPTNPFKLLYPQTGLPSTPWDPTKAGNNDPASASYNPILDDPTTSVRSAVFYCIQDQTVNTVNGVALPSASGSLRWRYPATTNIINAVTIDNDDGGGVFANNGFAQAVAGGKPFNTTALVGQVTDAVSSVTWTKPLPLTAPNQKWSVFAYIPAGTTEDYAHFATYTINAIDGNGNPLAVRSVINQNMATDQKDQNGNVVPNDRRVGGWRQIGAGIRFPGAFNSSTAVATNQSYLATASVTLSASSPLDVADAGGARLVVADAIQFVAESQTASSSVSSPLLANVDWGNTEPPTAGVQRQVAYFATTDGHIWALDALGTAAGNVAPFQPFTTTSTYWVYPSISNPALFSDPATCLPLTAGPYPFRGLQDDPNYNPDSANDQPNVGIDGDLAKTQVNGTDIFTPVRTVPDLGGWVSSPVMVRVQVSLTPLVYQKYLVIGNENGRLYAFDPVGRMCGGAPFNLSIAKGDNLGVPGTTRRLLTWPSLARDKWLRKSSVVSEFPKYTDDPAKGSILASPSVDAAITDPYFIATKSIFGTGDGHVFAVDLSYPSLKPNERISRSTVNNTVTDGQPLWLYPNDKTQIEAISQPGALSTDYARYVFTSGGRVYSIPTTAAAAPGGGPGTPVARWVYPFTATPPGNPGMNDFAPLDTEFTAPVLATPGSGFNGNGEAAFIANKDGRIFAFNNTIAGNVANPPLFTSTSAGATRASVTYLQNLERQPPYSTRNTLPAPALFLPLDNGALTAVDILTPAGAASGGGIVWAFADALIGAVPLSTVDTTTGQPTLTFFATSNAYRGGDAITANQFVFQGDEGNQDTGEVHGQMHAYGSEDIGLVTSGEPTIQPVVGGVELGLVDLWNGQRDVGAPNQVWDQFALPAGSMPPPLSPYNERKLNHQKANTKGNYAIYEWGDTIYIAAWGKYTGGVPPQVTFTISGSTNKQIPAIVTLDTAYTGPPLTTVDPVQGTLPAQPFVAKAEFTMSRGAADFPQTPGAQYRVSAFAQLNAGGSFYRTPTYYAGQFDDPAVNPGPPVDPNNTAAIGEPRLIVIAHPFALSTRGASASGQPNEQGWTDGVKIDNSTTDFTEILSNGNYRSSLVANVFVPTTLKDLIAPMAFVTHGSSAPYVTYVNNSNPGPGLMIADRSNLVKLNQRLSGLRIERTDLHWGWQKTTGDPFKLQTGNVMNPLPWETFPNTVPNVSPDYPDINREHASFKVAGQDMAVRGITLVPPTLNTATGVKTLNPTIVDLTVDAPKYQPANINGHYYDINGVENALLVGPMDRANGVPPAPNLNTTAPSAGYVGGFAVFVDINGDGIFQGFAPGISQGQRTILQANEEVFRQLNVGIGVPPDVNIRTEEETVDIGTVPHGEGYVPTTAANNYFGAFHPSYLGAYNQALVPNGQSPWDSATGFQLFKPFTVRNQGNVNLVNVRAAKVAGDYNIKPDDPINWFYMTSDQVQPTIPGQPYLSYTINNPALVAPPYSAFAGGVSPPFPPNAPGNIGVVTSLDHWAQETTGLGGFTRGTKWDNELWPSVSNGYTIPAAMPADYVVAGNPLGWTAYSRRRPTVGKPRPGDSAPRTMSIPDVYYGDPLGMLSALPQLDTTAGNPPRDTQPKISVAIPVGTPAGTYTMPVYVFEDHIPEQWRGWLSSLNPDSNTQGIGDDDGVMNTVVQVPPGGPPPNVIPEGKSNPFTLKVTVVESRLTNGSTAGSYVQIDNRNVNGGASLGSNIQPVGLRDTVTGNLVLYWPSNRQWNNNTWTDPGTPDAPWYLFSTELIGAATVNQQKAVPYFDWRYEPLATQWWLPMPQTQQYPAPALAQNLFPSQTSDLLAAAPPGTPLVPGNLNALTVKHATPSLAQDDDLTGGNVGMWLFWQGAAAKTGAAGGTFSEDTRTFYVPLTNGVAPNPNTTPPFSFLNDPALPKFGPKPLIFTTPNGTKMAFLFWYGGAQGRSRLYYNASPLITDVTRWSSDTLLPTPGTLQFQADPSPIHRRIFTTWFNPQGELLDCVDVVYTGQLSQRKQPETMLTRYALEYPRDANGVVTSPNPTGRLVAIPIGVQDRLGDPDVAAANPTPTPQTAWTFSVVNELMARQGNTTTWASRDVAWLYSANRWEPAINRFQRGLLDARNKTYFQIKVQDKAGNPPVDVLDLTTPPVLDTATGKVYVNSKLGGRVVVDPQGGTVTFNGVSPTNTDKVLLSYTPQTLRLNASRNQTGFDMMPAFYGANAFNIDPAWGADPGFTPRTHVEPDGADSQPVALLDTYTLPPGNQDPLPYSPNPRYMPNINPNVNEVQTPITIAGWNRSYGPPVDRMWLFYRKSDANSASPSTIWFKTMRLMVRLPRGVIRQNQTGKVLPEITVANNNGPYEVDWIRGRVYFTQVDEGNRVSIGFSYGRDSGGADLKVTPALYRVTWGDEISSAVTPGDATTSERVLPLSTPVNEGQVSAFKDPFQDKVWVFWSSTRAGTTDLYYMTLNPQFYTQPGF